MRTPFARGPAFALVVAASLLQAGPLTGADPAFTLYVPTSASIHGNAGAFFHTDLWLFCRAFDHSLTVTATYRCFTGPCSSATRTIVVGSRAQIKLVDVAAVLFGNPETAGAIELTYTSPEDDLVATTRTYTPNLPLPTNGTAIPALTLPEARTRALFLGLASNGGDLTAGFRTNAGAYNPGPDTVLTYTLFDDNGRPIGSTTQSLASRTAGQINDVFRAAGAGTLVTTNASLVVTSVFPVFPFVTVIDNQSGDSVYATRIDDLPHDRFTTYASNGSFDTGTGAWTNMAPSVITTSWSPTDSTGNPASGSVIVTNSDPHPNGGGSGPGQCVYLTPGSVVDFSARIRIPSGQPGTGGAAPTIYFYTGDTCNGTSPSYVWMTGPSRLDTWERQSTTATVPSGVNSGRLILWTGKTSAAGTFTAYFDDVSVITSAR